MYKLKIIIIVCTLYPGLWSLNDSVQDTTYLNRGLELQQQGKFEEALAIWEEARHELENPSLRIGRAYIELVTQENIKEYYPSSSEMYFWGLSSQSETTEEIDKELKMIEPIVDRSVFNTWKEDFKDTPYSALTSIQSFWLEQDITPDTPYNERLMEHWERIAYVKEHFTRNRSSIYGTDARGPVYIQFGKPNITHQGDLDIQHQAIFDLVIKKITTIQPGKILNESDRAYARNIANAAFDASGSLREYEIWVYTNHELGPIYNNVVIFGNTPIQGFARAVSVNDFIPPSANTFSKRFAVQEVTTETDYNMNPGLFIQHEYLRQLAGIDPQFGRGFSNLVFDFFRAGEPARKEEAYRYKREQEQLARVIENEAPDEVSIYEEAFPSIPVQLFTYRFLDNTNSPYSIVYLQSQPQGIFILDSSRNTEIMERDADNVLSYYDFIHGLQIRGSDQRLLASQELRPDIDIDINIESPPSISIFQVPYVSEDTWEVFYAQLKNDHPDTKPEIDSPFPNELRGIGTIKRQQSEPLQKEESMLQMSDMIIGFDLDETDDGSTFIPFITSHTKEIPSGENLAFHYELYHLQQNATGIAEFEIEFEILEKRTGLNRLRRNNPDFTLILNQQSDQSFFKENLEIETSDFEQGNYTLIMNILDQNSKQRIERKIDFSIK